MLNIRELKENEQHAIKQLRNNTVFIGYLKDSRSKIIASLVREKTVNEMIRLQGKLINITELLENIEG